MFSVTSCEEVCLFISWFPKAISGLAQSRHSINVGWVELEEGEGQCATVNSSVWENEMFWRRMVVFARSANVRSITAFHCA